MPTYERPNIHQLTGYTPGEQPEAAEVVKLNTNENPYPPSDAVLEAIASVRGDQLRRYPPPLSHCLRESAAKLHGLSPHQVIATNGGDELLRLAVTVFCEPSPSPQNQTTDHTAHKYPGGLGLAEPTYSLYGVLAAIHDTPVLRVNLEANFSLPEDFADRLNHAGCRLAMLVNPHAPSGRFQPIEQLRRIAEQFTGVLLIDEAYVNFAKEDALSLVHPATGLDNVLILRTLSKGYSLAGLRCGYGLGCANLIQTLDKVRDSYNLNILTQRAAVAALEHQREAKRTWQAVIDERAQLTAALQSRGFITLDSQTNFLLTTPPVDGPPASRIHEALAGKHIHVRYFNHDRLRDKLRISIGSPAQHEQLLNALDQIHS